MWRLSFAVALAAMATPAAAQVSVRYASGNVNLRESPSTSARIVVVIPRGSELASICDAFWCSVTTTAGQTGYVARSLLRNTPPAARALANPQPSATGMTDAEIRRTLIRESISSYSGNCPCPYNTDRAGRSCGRRSAHSRPGGEAPLCYESDISDAMVRRFRERRGSSGS
jgi:SH3 domain-containing protein